MDDERRKTPLADELADFGPVAAGANPGLCESADQPGPDGSLVVSAVAGADVAGALGVVVRRAGRERAQAERGQQARFRDVDHLAGAADEG